VPSSGETDDGILIYDRAFGAGFSLVIEVRPGGRNTEIGTTTFDWDPSNPTTLPDLQVLVSRALGNGSPEVCDDTSPSLGGVPAASDFAPIQFVADVINDLGCRFKNGSGTAGGRRADEACTIFADGRYRFVTQGTTVQYCVLVSEPLSFLAGETVVTARVRDTAGRLSLPVSIIVRIGL
jgi:hypothetical protein